MKAMMVVPASKGTDFAQELGALATGRSSEIGVDIVDGNRPVTECLGYQDRTQCTPQFFGELENRVFRFVPVATEGERELAIGVVLLAHSSFVPRTWV